MKENHSTFRGREQGIDQALVVCTMTSGILDDDKDYRIVTIGRDLDTLQPKLPYE